jgi:Bax protein
MTTPVGSLYRQASRVRIVVSFGIAAMLTAAIAADRGRVFASDDADRRSEATVLALFTPPSAPTAAPTTDLRAEVIYDDLVERGYTLDAVRNDRAAVPRYFLARLPSDLSELDSIDQRKEVFVKMLLPLVLLENERILADRQQLQAIHDNQRSGRPPSAQDIAWIEALAGRYGLADHRAPNLTDTLLKRVDVVSPALAIGQAALETGWGTSRGAQKGHAMFGQMTVVADTDKSVVRRFEHLAHAVEAYALNLNTHKAYARYRDKRAEQRNKTGKIDGYELANTIGAYSERKADYIRDVLGIMRANKLRALDSAKLG